MTSIHDLFNAGMFYRARDVFVVKVEPQTPASLPGLQVYGRARKDHNLCKYIDLTVR